MTRPASARTAGRAAARTAAAPRAAVAAKTARAAAAAKSAPVAAAKSGARTAAKAMPRAAAATAARSSARAATAERTATRTRGVPQPRTARGASPRVAGSTALAPRTAPPRPPSPPLSVAVAADAGSPRTPFVVLVFALVGAGLVGLLLLNTAVNENAFHLLNLDKQQKELDIREQQLRTDLDKRVSPGDLNAAASRLGLVQMGNQGFIYLPSGRVVGNPTPARARTPQVPVPAPSAAGGSAKPPKTSGGQPATADRPSQSQAPGGPGQPR